MSAPFKKWFKIFVLLIAVAAGLFAILYGWGMLMRPELAQEPIRYTEDELAAAQKLRDVSFDPEHMPVVQRDVDYTEGQRGKWFPQGQSPILQELEAQGIIPAVAERVGQEPLVLEGPEGIGNYGGTWFRVANSAADVSSIGDRLSGSTLVRWSPLGYPVRPHIAKGWSASEDRREWTFFLREGMKWSDGHPFTADDIIFWWKEQVGLLNSQPPPWMVSGGKVGDIVKVDDYTVKFVFEAPYGSFLEMLATPVYPYAPRHYLRQYHPIVGDKEKIAQMMQARGVSSPRAMYSLLSNVRNVDHPRLWPWVYRSYRSNPPESFVRNPYYWAVDSEGNQLPYIDRVLFTVKAPQLIPVAASSGEMSMQERHIRYSDYTLLMENRKVNDYEVYHWFPADRTAWALWPNQNRNVVAHQPDSANKAEVLKQKEFRQALSLAIDRENIIRAVYHGYGEPAQISPGRESAFHSEKLLKSFTEYDPDRANALLDSIGLGKRDSEGMRTFADGSQMIWYIDYTDYTGEGPVQFVIDDWAKVGIRAIQRQRSRPLFWAEKAGLLHDFSVWSGMSEFNPIVGSRSFVADHAQSHYALSNAQWFLRGGLYGNSEALRGGVIAPAPGSPIRRGQELREKAVAQSTLEGQVAVFKEILDIVAENVLSISIATPPPQLVVVKDGFRNVPKNAIVGYTYLTPANTGIETYFFDAPDNSPGAIDNIRSEMTTITRAPDMVAEGEGLVSQVGVLTAASQAGEPSGATQARAWESAGSAENGIAEAAAPRADTTSSLQASNAEAGSHSGAALGRLIWNLCLGILVLLFLLIAVRHPYIGRRVLILIPTLMVISLITFYIIQLPPGDYVETRILELQLNGDDAAIAEVERLREAFLLDRPFFVQYANWIGLKWFVTFKDADKGLLQGDMGRSMETQGSVNTLVGDRVVLTFVVSLATILFTWVIALPIGIYSAVRQYSVGDYILSFIGFIGMCIPNFLLAIVLMYWSSRYLGINVTGLFSPEYASSPEWTRGKVIDLLQHIWVPVIVIGTAGTAGMIRVMRGNLLDELRKPYVTTAMAKGVRPFRLLMKYPVRLALNPFISGIGNVFPQLVSGGAIIAIVLSLPMVGPLLLQGLMTQDVYLAGSMLMTLSLLSVFGTLVSDLLLLWLDPRIRMEGGSR